MIRSMLFLPGNSPSLLGNGDILGADAIIFDLEDAVAPAEKDAARILVRHALPKLKRDGLKHIVRINPLDETGCWIRDLDQVLPMNPDFIMPTKVSGLNMLNELLCHMRGSSAKMIPLIETAEGVEHAYEIAKSPGVYGILLGAEDLTCDLQCPRTKAGDEILYARGRIVMAARAAGVLPFDTPFTDVNDDDGLIEDAKFARGLGFSGKAAISPRHVAGINRAFSPSAEDISYAREVLEIIERGKREGKGAVSLRGKMIDLPVVNRAKQVLQMAEAIEGGGAM